MKIFVPFKVVWPSEVAVAGGGTGMAAADAKGVLNPFDAIAIEEGLQIKERAEGVELVCVTIGPSTVQEQARAALAMGADRVVHVDDPNGPALDPYAVARILRVMVEREGPDLVIMGKQAVDDDSNQVGQMLAGLLDWPQATFVSEIDLTDDPEHARCTRETDDGLEVIAVRLPAVITTDLRLNEPRYVSLPGLIKARRKPIETLNRDELVVDVCPRTTVLEITCAPKRAAGTRVESVGELVEKLRGEAKVL